jgi:CubicO group peptidase (beta-lactamase class C family)
MKKTVLGIAVALLLGGGVFLAMSDGHPVRQLVAMFAGAEAVEYSAPRLEVSVPPGPPQPRVPPGEAGIDPKGIAAAVAYADGRNTRALIVGRGGHIVFEKYWGTTTIDSPADVSGFTPVLSALVVGTALHDRSIPHLDAQIGGFLAQWHDDSRGAITLRQLLTGDSGLATPRWPWPRTLAARYFVGGSLRSTLLSWPLDAAQREGMSPIGVDVDVLSIVLAEILKQPYPTLLVERVWKPLGGGGFSMGHDGDAGSAGHVRAGCCLRARIGDWMRIGELLANDGVFEGDQLTPPRYVSLMLKPTRKDSPRGFFTRVDGAFAARDVARLEAAGRQRLWIVPSLKLVILRTGTEPSVEKGWDEAMIPDSIIRASSGWQPASVREGVDPNNYAPH